MKEFKIMRSFNSLEIIMSSTYENIDNVCRETKAFIEKTTAKNHSFGILLSMREALLNAVLHGNNNNSNKIVKYSLRIANGYLFMVVEDEGNGFDWRACLCKEPEISSHCGRGMSIMRLYSTDIIYNERGNRLLLKQKVNHKN